MFGALIGGGLSLAGSIMGGNRALRAAELGAKSDAVKLSPEFGEAKRREIARKKDMLRAQAMFSPEAFKYGPIAFPRVS